MAGMSQLEARHRDTYYADIFRPGRTHCDSYDVAMFRQVSRLGGWFLGVVSAHDGRRVSCAAGFVCAPSG